MTEMKKLAATVAKLLAAYAILSIHQIGNAQHKSGNEASGSKPDQRTQTPELQPYETRFKVSRVLTLPNESNRVLIDAGSDQSINEGSLYDVMRSSNGHGPKPIWVKTGAIKIVKSNDQYALGLILEQGTTASYGFFPKFPTIMVGDTLFDPQITIVQKRLISPIKSLAYAKIFVDPKAYPTTFELSSEGKNLLRELAAYYHDLKAPLLLIEGYTDDYGPSDANQVESYQRALTVRQFLVEEVGFDPARVVAIGFGKAELDQNTHVPGKADTLRRIAFKVNSAASPLN